jgi:hypothetical protein
MTAHRITATLARCAVLAFLFGTPAAAQVAVFPVQDLSFGILRPGSPEQVATEDPMRRAEIELIGTGNVTITFGLPSEMVSVSGSRLPLQFTKGDAEIEMRGSGKDKDFDPTKSKTIKIKNKEGGARIYLGGLAFPTSKQPPGRYRATITVQVVTPGT